MGLKRERRLKVKGRNDGIIDLLKGLKGVTSARYSKGDLRVAYDLDRISLMEISRKLSVEGYVVDEGLVTRMIYVIEKNQVEAREKKSCTCCCR